MLIWYDLVWNNNLGYVRLNGSYNILKSINFQVAGIPSLCKEKNMNVKSMSYTGKVLWTVWELDVEDYEILFYLNSTLNFGIPPVLVFQLEVYYKEDRLLTGLTAQQKRTTDWWYSHKTSLLSDQ